MRIITYSFPTYWVTGGFMQHLIGDVDDWSGAELCSPALDSCLRGFRCTSNSSASVCYGHTGEQVLDSLHEQYDVIMSDDIFAKHFGILFALACAIKLIFGCVLFVQSRGRVEVDPCSAAEPPAPTPKALAACSEDQEASKTPVRGSTIEHVHAQLTVSNISLQLEKEKTEAEEGKFLLRDVSARVESTEVHTSTNWTIAPPNPVHRAWHLPNSTQASPSRLAPTQSHPAHPAAGCFRQTRQVLAVMGPSGAGKTTFLNVLTSTAVPGRDNDHITGDIMLNGVELSPALLRMHCAHIEQNDVGLYTFLSCADHVRYAVALFQGGLRQDEIPDAVAAILTSTGLTSCQHTRAGDVDNPGLSSGQRRRLSLAVALAKRPALLIADEPTSGLDDAAAAAIMKLFGELAREDCMAVVCTIHQPSASVYAGIGTLLLLTKGRTAYYGPASELIDYVAALGKPVQAGVSVSEHALSLINADFTSDAHVEEVIEAWRKKAPPLQVAASMPLPLEPVRAPFGRVLLILCEKIAKITFQGHTFVLSRCFTYVGLSLLYGLITLGVRGREQSDVIPTAYVIYFMFSNLIFTAQSTTLAMSRRRPKIKVEIGGDMYGPIAYWAVSSLIGLLVSSISAFCNLPMTYALLDFGWSSFMQLWLLTTLLSLFLDAASELLMFSELPTGMLFTGMMALHSAFSCGLLVPTRDIIWPLKLSTYILPGRFYMTAALNLIFTHSKAWHGAVRASTAPTGLLNSPAGRLEANQVGFVCPEAADNARSVCYADNGADILTAISVCSPARPPPVRTPSQPPFIPFPLRPPTPSPPLPTCWRPPTSMWHAQSAHGVRRVAACSSPDSTLQTPRLRLRAFLPSPTMQVSIDVADADADWLVCLGWMCLQFLVVRLLGCARIVAATLPARGRSMKSVEPPSESSALLSRMTAA